VHRKLFGMTLTSNTCKFFLNWRNFMATLTNMTKQIQNKYCCYSSDKSNNSDVKQSVPKWLRQRPSTENSNMAAQTGNTYISGTIIDSVEIPTTVLVFSTMKSSEKVPPNDCDNDRLPEIAIWPLKRKWLYFWKYDRVEIRHGRNPRIAIGISTLW